MRNEGSENAINRSLHIFTLIPILDAYFVFLPQHHLNASNIIPM